MPDSSVKVVCRFRPVNAREREEGDVEGAAQLDFPDAGTVIVRQAKQPPQTFSFDRVFHDVSVTQREVYEYAAKETVQDVIQGYNGTIFAYGQTGAGKSFSMFGADVLSKDLKGIIPRACEHIFKYIEADTTGTEFTIKCSFLEIYKEVVRDLVDPERVNLKVRETPSRGVWVDGLSEHFVTSVEDVMDLLSLGEKHRATSSTKMNSVSSRSHSLFILALQQRSPDGSMKEGRLNLADLAGSEKVGKTGATGETLEEAKKINQSLSALGNCINALTKAKKGHVPYRDSRLTHILRESLGGNSKTTLLIACSPHSFNVEETISTLKFGQRAKSIKTSARINQTRSVAELEAIIAKMTKELDFWKSYATELEAIIMEKIDKNFDFQEVKKRIISALAKNEAPVEVVEEAESLLSPPTSPRRGADQDDDSPAPSAPTSPAGAAAASDDESLGLVGDSRGVIEMQLNMEKLKENLTLKIQDLQEDLNLVKADREEQIQRLAMQQQELEEVQSLLKKEREEHQMRLQAFEYELKKLARSNDEKAEDVERALKDASALKQQLESVAASKATIEAERNKFYSVLSQAKADVLRYREEAAKSVQLETKLLQLAERFQAQEDRRSELESLVSNAHTANETIRLQLDAKEHENTFLEGEVQRLREKLHAMEEQTEHIKEDLHKKLMEKTSQASALSADAAAAAETARISSKRSGDAATLETDLADAKRLNIQLQSDIAIKDVKIREMQTRLDDMAKELQRSNGRLDTEKSAFSQLEKRFQEVESQLHAQQITKEAIDADLSESKRNASALENQLSVVRVELERAQKDSAAQLQRMQKQLDQANERVAELESTRDKMYDQNADLKSTLDAAKAQIAQLTASAAAASLAASSTDNLSRTSTPVGSLSSSMILSEDSFEDLEASSKPARGGNIRKPITKSQSTTGAKKTGPASPVKPAASTAASTTAAASSSTVSVTQTPKKAVAATPAATAGAPATPSTPVQPTASDNSGTPSPNTIGTRTKKEKGFFGRIFGDIGPTKRYVSEVKTKEGTLWTHVGMMSTWKAHTFMLWENNMHGWRPSSVDLDRDADITIRVDGVTVKVADAPVKSLGYEGPYQFTLIYANKKQIVLGATTAAEAQSWATAINELNARLLLSGASVPLATSTSSPNLSVSDTKSASEPSAAIPVPSPVPVPVPDPDVLSSSTPK